MEHNFDIVSTTNYLLLLQTFNSLFYYNYTVKKPAGKLILHSNVKGTQMILVFCVFRKFEYNLSQLT